MPARKRRKAPAAPITSVAPVARVRRIPVADLAAHLLDPGRDRTAVVISHKRQDPLHFDADRIAGILGDAVDVFEVVDGADTRAFEKLMPAQTHVFGVAARVYAPDASWQTHPHRSVLRLPHTAEDVERLTEKLRHDVSATAWHAQDTAALPVIRPDATRATARGPARVTASVKEFNANGTTAVVVLVDGGGSAEIHADDLFPSIPLDWILSVGQVLTGTHNPADGTFDVSALAHGRPTFTAVYRDGQLALARVVAVRPAEARLQFWPGTEFTIGIGQISSNELDSAQDLLTEGEVVCVRVQYVAGEVALSMLDVDDDEPVVPAPALVPGGPPWLALDRPYASLFAPAARRPDPAPVLSAAERKTALQTTQRQLATAQQAIAALQLQLDKRGATDEVAAALQRQLEAERSKNDDLARLYNDAVHRVDELKRELASSKSTIVDLRKKRRTASSRSDAAPAPAFTDPADQFRHEVYLAWADQVPAVDKDAETLGVHALGNYSLGDGFLSSIAALPAPRRAKVLRAVVDLVANRDGPLHNREPHWLRQNEGAHAPAVQRGGDVCWRLYVEQKAPAALRLHYWKLKDGGIELSRVVLHDDLKP
ncbi:hypothetical protein [Specibacter cremeus]|uniref:hypothetical protein n=1 Tax=Specibacter cremeus TaxID=1629051 RepID=UPI000F76A679|nr:hypothetical protein [Specibacter cremeus]